MSRWLRVRSAVLLLVYLVPVWAAPGISQESETGWACGIVVEESFSFVIGAELALLPVVEPGAGEPDPVAHQVTDAGGSFCFKDIPPGHYQLRISQVGWPLQPLHPLEIRAGLLNRLTPIEMELEPGEPRISYHESLDGMPMGQDRSMFERLLLQGDSASLAELARRLLPKRGPEIDLGRLARGLDTKPVVDELLRQLDRAYLPPLKTARYLFVVGELADSRTRERVIPLLLDKLRDARPIPVRPTAVTDSPSTRYVGDIAMYALVRLAGREFGWKYGRPPMQNANATTRARDWWRQELEKRQK